MPRPTLRRLINGKLRRLPIRDCSKSSRSLGLNSTQQTLLRKIHANIKLYQLLIRRLLTTVSMVHLLHHIHPNADEYFTYLKRYLLYVVAHITSILQVYIYRDAALADISLEEEQQHIEARQDDINQVLPQLLFDSLSPTTIKSMTRFPLESLIILKTFFNLPEHIYIHPGAFVCDK